MISKASERIAAALNDPSRLIAQDLPDWEALIRQARSTNLLGCLASRLDDAGLLVEVPHGPREHLQSSLVLSQAQSATVTRELAHLRSALVDTMSDIVLLKGAAYLTAGLPAARGRMFTDIDILVPRAHLPAIEAALMIAGWATTHLNAYDQRYYRDWMHELPPMRHVTRGTVVDVHHAILPTTARQHPDSRKLLALAQSPPREPLFKVLAPIDMVLHNATHLFYNDDLSNGLRDLVDLDALLRDFDRLPSFWSAITARAEELELARPLYYGLRYAARLLGTRVPKDVIQQTARLGPRRPFDGVMDALFTRVLAPVHPDVPDPFAAWAGKLLYVRAHWLRMPSMLLTRHLIVKAFRRESAEAKTAAVNPARR